MAPPKKKKGPPARQKIPIEIKQFAIDKYDQKVKNSEICAMILKRFKVTVCSSTVSTWNTPKAREKIAAMGVDNITSKEIRINQVQRPRIIVDMEFFLLMYIERQQDNSIPVTTRCIQEQAKILYNKLASTGIYSNKGQRLHTLKDLTEQCIEELLHPDEENENENENENEDRNISCLYESCDRQFMNNADLLAHISSVHLPPSERAVRGSVENIQRFTASNGWLQKLLKRHGIRNVAMVGEKGSCDYDAAVKYVSDLRKHLIECNYMPQHVMEILINIDECGLQWKSLPKKNIYNEG